MTFMMRSCEDDFVALKTIDAMESVGATVVSITVRGQETYSGALAPHLQYIVWARVRDDAHIDEIDAAIERKLEGPPG